MHKSMLNLQVKMGLSKNGQQCGGMGGEEEVQMWNTEGAVQY